MKQTYFLGNRLAALALCLLMVITMLPAGSAFTADNEGYAEVTAISDGATITGSGSSEVTASFAGTLTWLSENPDVGIATEGWWVGLKVTAPQNVNMETAKYKMGGTEMLFKEGKHSQDSASEQYIELWSQVEEDALTSESPIYIWSFDWDGDGTYEQTLTLNVYASRTILKDKGGNWVYPAPGQVTSYSGGSITSNGTANVTVTIEELSLECSKPGDTYAEGWWAGIRVNAPEGMDNNSLKKATYQVQTGDDASQSQSFWDNKGSQESDSVQFISLWVQLTPELVEEEADLTTTYWFDWDGDGTKEQTVTFTLAFSNGKVQLNDKEQTGFAFETLLPKDIKVFETYTNKAAGGQGDGQITYEIISGSDYGTIDAQTGELKAKKPGVIKVQATKAADSNGFYKAATATYQITVVRGFSSFSFEVSNPDDITYAPDLTYSNKATDKANRDITYSVDDSKIATIDEFGTLTILKSGTVKVTASVEASGVYQEQSISYTLVINKAAQTDFAFDPDEALVYLDENNNQYQLSIKGVQSTGAVSYAVKYGSKVATVDQDGMVSFTGVGTVVIEATKAADDCYEAATASFTLSVRKRQSAAFAGGTEVSLVYGAQTNYTHAITLPDDYTGTPSYEFSSNNIGAKIDGQSGEVTFDTVDKAGTATVKVTLPGDDTYGEYSASYTITLKFEPIPETPYALDGDKKIETSNWYTGGVTITPAEGYLISYSNSQTATDWKESLVWTEDIDCVDNEDPTPAIYLRNAATGGITDKILIQGLYRDATAPSKLSIGYKEDVLADIAGKFFGFVKSEVTVTVSAEDNLSGIGKMEYSLDGGNIYSEISPNEEGIYTFDVTENYRGQLYLRATDKAGNQAIIAHQEDEKDKVLVVDKTDPGLKVVYDGTSYDPDKNVYYAKCENGEKVTVTFTVSDENFDLREKNPVVKVGDTEQTGWVLDDEVGTGTLKLEFSEEGDYTISAFFADRLGREATHNAEVRIDRTAPVIDVLLDATSIEEGDCYKKNQTFTFQVTEHNFDTSKVELTITGTSLTETVELDLADLEKNAEWTSNGDVHELTFTLKKELKYTLKATVTDPLGHITKYERMFSVDETAPSITLSYREQSATEDLVFHELADKLFGISDLFRFANEAVVVTVNCEDEVGEIKSVKYKLNANDDYQTIEKSKDGKYTFTVAPEYRGQITVEVTDSNGKIKEFTDEKGLIVDAIAPKVNVEFSTDSLKNAVMADSGTVIDRSDKDSYDGNTRFIYNGDIVATITLDEDNFSPDDDKVSVQILRNDSALTLKDWKDNGIVDSGWSWDDEKQAYTRQLRIEADSETNSTDGDYQFVIGYTDYSGNPMMWTSGEYDNNAGDGVYRSNVHTLDTIAPDYTVSFDPSRVVSSTDLKDLTVEAGVVDDQASSGSRILYFSGDAAATIRIKEANFFPDAVSIQVVDEAGKEISTQTQAWSISGWTAVEGTTDEYECTVTMEGEGDYWLKIDYQDYAMNTPIQYHSDKIVVDKTSPQISTVYKNTDVKNTIGGRDYFAAEQTAVITIKERNFRADDVKILVTAKNFRGDDILIMTSDGQSVQEYATEGSNRENWSAYQQGTWRRVDDEYQLILSFDVDANYTLSVQYQDLAGNEAAAYEPGRFTVDKTFPQKLGVSYSGTGNAPYYNDKVTVTITAEDDISGVLSFAYSYIKGANVSNVNAQLLDQAISQAQITYDPENPARATATFTIPRDALGRNNQFNGTVSFTAFDHSENGTTLKDDTQIVVDNISPTADVVFNVPTQTANDVSYYNGSIQAEIVITEANFNARDVRVTVTRNGAAYPVDVNWVNNTVDIHTGTFTLAEDGDYVVSIDYTDKSGNRMAQYTSKQMTVDTRLPVIKVSGVKANSANKDEKYGFTLEISDTNLNVNSMKPVLKAVIRDAQGDYKTVEIDMGEPIAVLEGQTYRYTIENLPEDALYTITCQTKDMALNEMSQILLDDGVTYEKVQFSINRNGSAFGYGDDYTEALSGKYYTFSVESDLVVVEVNVDPIERYVVSLNGQELAEGTDYITEQTSREGEWSKRTYIIKKELFAAEGEYNIIISSTDKSNTTAFSDIKDLALAFVVDQTKPVIIVTGLESGGRYQTDLQTVTLIPTDEGGRLQKIVVTALDSDGMPLKDENGDDISVRFEMSGDELLKHLEENDGKILFTIPVGLNNQVSIVCTDCATAANGQTNEYREIFSKVTVSPNRLVIFYANTPLFIGSIAGGLAVIMVIIFLFHRRKKDKENSSCKAGTKVK